MTGEFARKDGRGDRAGSFAAYVASALLLSASILPQAAMAQTVTVGAADADGADDEQAQSDLTAIELQCPAAGSSPLTGEVFLDPVSNSGGNSSDISILFDTDGDGNANYSYVITVGNDPFQVLAIALQSGRNDTSAIKISGNTTDVGIGSTTASTSISIGTNPFDGSDDTEVSFNLDLDAIANHAGVVVDQVQFLNVTTIPSSSATSDPKDVLLSVGQAFTSDDFNTTDVDSSVNTDTLSNDSSKIDWSTAQIMTPPSHGAVTINADGTIDYVPDGDYTGVDTFSYSAVALDCTTYTSNVTITITGLAAVDDSGSGTAGVVQTPISNIRENDSLDGGSVSATNTTITQSGTWPTGFVLNASTGAIDVDAAVAPGTYTMDYEICTTGSSPICKIATATIVLDAAEVDFSITKANGVDTLTSGDTTTYTITVSHNGTDPISGAVVTDTPGAGITCDGSTPVTITGDGVPSGSFTFSDLSSGGIALGVLTTGQSTTLSYSCQVN